MSVWVWGLLVSKKRSALLLGRGFMGSWVLWGGSAFRQRRDFRNSNGHKIIFMAQVAYFGLLQDEATCYEYMKNIKRPASIGKSQHLRLLRPSY